jgi:tetratricopeptide (TPR) repeat protein
MIEQLIKEEKFEEALKLLTNEDNELAVYQKLVCLCGLNKYEEAVELAIKAIKIANKYYYDIISLYVTALVALNQDEKAISLLESELTMPYIPFKYANYFNETYDLLIKRKNQNAKPTNYFSSISTEELSTILIDGDNKDVLVSAIYELKQRNIRLFLPLIRSFLKDDKKPRFAKALLLEALVEQGINEEFTFKTAEEQIEVNPKTLEVIVSNYVYDLFTKAFKNPLLDKNPSLLEYCFEVLTGYLGSIYPLTIEDDEVNLIAAAIHLYVLSLNSDRINVKEIASSYQVEDKQVEMLADKIAENINSLL